jgi:hypothetical protein
MTATTEILRSESDEIRELEALWSAPAARRRPLRRRSPAARVLELALPLAWGAVLVLVISFAPASNPQAATPLWAELTLTAWWGALVAAGILAWMGRGGPALVGSLTSACLGVVLGYGCRATQHHAGSWWLVETIAFAGLALLSVAGLAARRASRAT